MARKPSLKKLEQAFWKHQQTLSKQTEEELNNAKQEAKETHSEKEIKTLLAQVAEEVRLYNQRLVRR